MFWYLNVYYELSNKLSVSANMLVMDQLEIMFKHNIYGSTEINIFKEIIIEICHKIHKKDNIFLR